MYFPEKRAHKRRGVKLANYKRLSDIPPLASPMGLQQGQIRNEKKERKRKIPVATCLLLYSAHRQRLIQGHGTCAPIRVEPATAISLTSLRLIVIRLLLLLFVAAHAPMLSLLLYSRSTCTYTLYMHFVRESSLRSYSDFLLGGGAPNMKVEPNGLVPYKVYIMLRVSRFTVQLMGQCDRILGRL